MDITEPYEELCTAIVEDSCHNEEVVRVGAGLALAQVLMTHPEHTPVALDTLLGLYQDKLHVS